MPDSFKDRESNASPAGSKVARLNEWESPIAIESTAVAAVYLAGHEQSLLDEKNESINRKLRSVPLLGLCNNHALQ